MSSSTSADTRAESGPASGSSTNKGSFNSMAARKAPDHTQQLSPVRVAPLGELTAYTVHEHELDIIAAGSPATLTFNFAIALFSVGVTFVVTLTTTTIGSDRLFYGYLIVCINCLLVGTIMFVYWLRTRTSVEHHRDKNQESIDRRRAHSRATADESAARD